MGNTESTTNLSSSISFNEKLKRHKSKAYNIFSQNEIKEITNDFSKVIGKGDTSTVYYGTYHNLKVAVKMYNVTDRTVFCQEVENITRCTHPNVVLIIGISECSQKNVYLVLEYMEKGSLYDYLRNKKDAVKIDNKEKKLKTLIEICSVLHYFHEQKIIHRDIKPGNILFDAYGKPKVTDFNTSKFCPTLDTSHIASKWGRKPSVLDPVLIKYNKCGSFTDVYSFGILMLQFLTHRENYGGIAEEAEKIFNDRDNEKLKEFFVDDWDEEVAMRLLVIPIECLKNNERERPSAIEISERLENIIDIKK